MFVGHPHHRNVPGWMCRCLWSHLLFPVDNKRKFSFNLKEKSDNSAKQFRYHTACPSEQPDFGSACSLTQNTQCQYGEECCCGQCYPRSPKATLFFVVNQYLVNFVWFKRLSISTMMRCDYGTWTGYYTDACRRPHCGNTTGKIL